MLTDIFSSNTQNQTHKCKKDGDGDGDLSTIFKNVLKAAKVINNQESFL